MTKPGLGPSLQTLFWSQPLSVVSRAWWSPEMTHKARSPQHPPPPQFNWPYTSPLGTKESKRSLPGLAGTAATLRSPSPWPCSGQLRCCPLGPKLTAAQASPPTVWGKRATHHCWTSFSVTARENRSRLLALGGALGEADLGNLLPALPSPPLRPTHPCPPDDLSQSGAACPATPAGDSTGLSLLRPTGLLEGLTRTASSMRGWLSLPSWGLGGAGKSLTPRPVFEIRCPPSLSPGTAPLEKAPGGLPACGGPGQEG